MLGQWPRPQARLANNRGTREYHQHDSFYFLFVQTKIENKTNSERVTLRPRGEDENKQGSRKRRWCNVTPYVAAGVSMSIDECGGSIDESVMRRMTWWYAPLMTSHDISFTTAYDDDDMHMMTCAKPSRGTTDSIQTGPRSYHTIQTPYPIPYCRFEQVWHSACEEENEPAKALSKTRFENEANYCLPSKDTYSIAVTSSTRTKYDSTRTVVASIDINTDQVLTVSSRPKGCLVKRVRSPVTFASCQRWVELKVRAKMPHR